MAKKFVSTKVAALAATAILLGGCGTTAGGGDPKLASLTGTINADGSSTVFPISQAIAELFNEDAPKVKVSVGTSGTGGGFEKFCAGETDLSDASRPIKDEEKQKCTAGGVEYVQLQVAVDGLSVLVNPSNNFAECLTVDELKKIWAPGSTVKNWNAVRSGFPDRPLSLYGPGTDSGTFDYFTDEIVGEEGASRDDYTASENDNDLVTGVGGDQNALGYFGFAYYAQNRDKLKLVGVDPGEGCVKPSKEAIQSGKYKPLSRPLFIYVSKKAAAKPEVSSFVDFYLESVNDIVADVGYVPMPDEALEKATADWEGFRG
ncbi:MAG: PstS family phosphate ABC transporter substrate-binding protein [Actinomycetota bacterium]